MRGGLDNIFNKINTFNNIDILINNAGLGIFNKIDNTSYDDWDIQMNTNLKGSFMMTKNIVPIMKKNNNGKIVFINSVAGLKGYPYSSAYVASKYGLRGFSSSIREELREYNIKVIFNIDFWQLNACWCAIFIFRKVLQKTHAYMIPKLKLNVNLPNNLFK